MIGLWSFYQTWLQTCLWLWYSHWLWFLYYDLGFHRMLNLSCWMWCKIQALEEMAKTNQGKITCPRTNEVCNFSDLARAYISWCLLDITSFCVFLGSSNQELTALQTSQHGVKSLPLVSQGYLQSPCNQQFDHWCEYSFSFNSFNE